MASANVVTPDTRRSREVAARVARRPWALRIAGQEVSGDPNGWESISPATGEHLVTVPAATPADVDLAVRAGRAAFESWRWLAPRERAARVRAWATLVSEHAQELAELDAIDAGLPYSAALADVRTTVATMEMNAEWALELKGATVPASSDHLHYTIREPFGVVARIGAYNHPLMFAARASAGLVAGNAVIVKSPDQAPLSGLVLAELADEIFPRGLVTVLCGAGPIVGDAIVRHPEIRRIAFTGSVGTGLTIQATAAASGSVKSLSFELGGKNPLVLFPDADLQAAARGALNGMNLIRSSGQSCGSTSRLVVHASVADQIVALVREQFESVVVGDPFASGTQMGPVVSEAHRDRVLEHVQGARRSGATVVMGGEIPAGLEAGWYVEPTLLTDVTAEMPIAQEEVFGPVLSVITWEDEREAVEIANGVGYGLTASIWTRDVARAHRLAREIDAGFIWVNETSSHFRGVPFGGFKNSGVGREEDLSELLSYTQVKSVNVPLER